MILTVDDFNNKWLWFYGGMLLFATVIFILGFNKENYLITLFAGFIILSFALVFTTKGYPTITDNYIKLGITLISIGLGLYITIYSGFKFVEESL